MARPDDEEKSDNAQSRRLGVERAFKREHGSCDVCGGTGFESFEKGGYSYTRPCPRRGMVSVESAQPARRDGGFTPAQASFERPRHWDK